MFDYIFILFIKMFAKNKSNTGDTAYFPNKNITFLYLINGIRSKKKQ